MLYNYLKELEETFGEDAMSMMLLKTTTMMYPLLNRFGISLYAPVAVIVDEECGLRKVSEHLFGFGKGVVKPLTESPKNIEKQTQNPEYGLSIFRCDRDRYTKDNLETIRSSCAQIGGDISEQKVAVVLFSPCVPRKCEDIFAGYVYIKTAKSLMGKDSFNNLELLKNLIEKVLDKMEEIQYDIRFLCPDGEDGFQVFWAAGAVLRVILKYENMDDCERERYRKMINSALDMMRDRWENASDPEEFVSECISRIHDTRDRLFFIQSRKQNKNGAIGSLERIVLYDRGYYYISHDLFEEICEPITNGFGINYVKYQLFEGGLLVGKEDSSTYETKQIWVYDECGKKIRKRYYKLFREMIDQEEDLTL